MSASWPTCAPTSSGISPGLELAFFELDAFRRGDGPPDGEHDLIKSAAGTALSQALRNLILLGALVMMFVTSAKLSLLVLVAIPLIVFPLIVMAGSSAASPAARRTRLLKHLPMPRRTSLRSGPCSVSRTSPGCRPIASLQPSRQPSRRRVSV